MSILAANLKHLYQRRGAWFWYVILFCQAPMILLPLHLRITRYLGYLIISLLMGILAGGLQKDILTKPFSFCLPNHRQIPRAFIFWICGVVNLFLGCVFLGYPGLGFPYVLLVFLAGSFVGMIVYFYGVYVSFQAVPTPAGGIIPILIFAAVFFKWDVIVQNVVVNQPIVMILVGGLMCIWCWKLLDGDFLVRKYCGKLVRGILDDWNRTKIEKYKQARADRNMTESKVKFFEKVQEFFLGKMELYGFLSRGRYIWGNIYMVFGKLFGFWNIWHVLGFLGTILFLVLFFGFMGPSEKDKRMIGFLFIVPTFSVCSIDLTPYRTFLFPAGRRDKYYGTLILSVVVTLLSGLLVLVMTGISVFLETMLPEFSFRGELILSYYGMDICDFYIYLLFMPVTLSLAVAFPRTKPWFIIVLVVVIMQGWIISNIVLKQSLVKLIGPVSIAGLIALCWIGFLVVLHYVCMRRSLVGQGR
ncbi:MAG: hypothetical protein ACYS9Y_07705 [Planctomycetota bacterium]|jgi:hypothetical protein